ncbi:MAG: AAA family ATPase [Acidimicrobiia bacterium]
MSSWRADPGESDELIVDRAAEQAEVVRSLREALAGTPRVLLIEGHAGLGKSRLLRWLGSAASDVGALLVSGTALDGIEIAFLPWAGLAEVVPDAFAPAPADVPAIGDEGASMAHLVRATSAVFALASRRSLVIVLDDMQWADPASALLLQQLVFAAGSRGGPTRLLLAVAARPPEDERPAAAALRRIAREPIVRRVPLRPLSDVGVGELIGALSGHLPDEAQLHDVVDRTGGNPLFVRSWWDVQHGASTTGSGEAAGVVHQLIGDRVRVLSPDGMSLLESLAVIADSCPIELHRLLAGTDSEALAAELVAAGLVTVTEERVDFVHALFRQALLDRMGDRRIDELRARISRRLLASEIVDDLAPGLVIDLCRRATHGADLTRLGIVACHAAELAYAAGGWSRAADMFGLAADAGAELSVPMLQRWGIARFRAHDVGSTTVLLRAADAATAAGDVRIATTSLVLAARGLLTLGGGGPTQDIEERVLALAESPDPSLDPFRPALFGIAAECCFARFETATGLERAARARAAVGPDTDPASRWAVDIAQGLQLAASLDHEGARQCFDDAARGRWSTASPWHKASASGRLAMVEFVNGDVATSALELAGAMRCAKDAHHWSELAFCGALATAIAALRGDPAVEVVAAEAHQMLRRSEYQPAATILHPALAFARVARGDVAGARRALDAMQEVGLRGRRHLSSIALVAGSDPADAGRRRPPGGLSLYTLSDHAAALQLATATKDEATVQRLLPGVAREVELGSIISLDWPYLLPRVLAEAGALVDDRRVSHWLELTEEHARRYGLVYDRLRAMLLRSQLLMADGRIEAATRQSADVIRRADEVGMLAVVAAAQRALELMGAEDRGSLISRVVLVTDMVSSTGILHRLGDPGWMALLDDHDALAEATIRTHGGVMFKHTGDGVCAWFTEADDAVSCARSLLAAFEDRTLGAARDRIDIRIGLAQGRPIFREGDLFGATMVEAVRFCAGAVPGTGLATADVHAGVGGTLAPGGDRVFKGFDRPVATYVVTRH